MMLKMVLAATAAVVLSTAALAQPAAEDARLEAFLNAEFEQQVAQAPQTATQLGRKDFQDKLNDYSEAGAIKRLEWRRASTARMKRQFDRAKLSPEGQLNYDLWAVQLERAELQAKYRAYTPLGGWSSPAYAQLPNFLINNHLVDTAADMKGYNARLRAMGAALDQMLANDQASARKGIRAPRFFYERVIVGARGMITGQPFDAAGPDSPLWADAKAKVAKLQTAGKVTTAEAAALLDETRAALTGQVKPAYERTIAWVRSDIEKAPRSGPLGALTLPEGKAYYAATLKLQTTTDLTADQIHELGLSEVKRIQAEQDAIARKEGVADANAFYAELARRDPRQPYTEAQRAEVLAISNGHVARARAALAPYFGLLPAYRMEVVREPSFSEVAGGAAHASAPSPDGARPGRVYLHMLGQTPSKDGLASLMCHEAVPGHVMQGDIAVRQKGGPTFRKLGFGYAAFSEGWGLYAEALCKEMGVFQTTAQDFMRLDAELFRAARLVTDTGLHAKGWTEEQAVAYLIETAHRSPDSARSETRRYITNPGQATSYKVGMLKIQALRREAEQALGPKFDIKGFHDLVIGAGSMPLSLLETRVKAWVAARKTR